jgi:hypothetical protein
MGKVVFMNGIVMRILGAEKTPSRSVTLFLREASREWSRIRPFG